MFKLFLATLVLTNSNGVTTSTAITDYPDRLSCERDAADLTRTLEHPDYRIITTAQCRPVGVAELPPSIYDEPFRPLPPSLVEPYSGGPRYFQSRPGCWRPGNAGCYSK